MSEHESSQLQGLLSIVGPKLKAARREKDLTLKEISSATRINVVFLERIESAQAQNLPGLTFVRGFIRNYLQVLELQDEEIEEQLRGIATMDEYLSQTALGPEINEMHGDDSPAALPAQRLVIMGLVAVLVVAAGYMGIRLISRSGEEAPAQPAVMEKAAGEPSSPTDSQTPGGQPEQPAPTPPARSGARATRGVPLEAPQNLRLTMRGLEPTWIRLSLDRAPPVEVRLKPAETMNWEASEEIRIVIGKSHGVAVYLNGEDILMPEERNQLIPNIVLNKLTLLRLEN